MRGNSALRSCNRVRRTVPATGSSSHPPQARRRAGSGPEPGVLDVIHHDAPVPLMRVHEVKDEERIGVEPAHRTLAVARHHRNAGAASGLPVQRPSAARGSLDIDHHRTDEEHGVPGGNGEIMHHEAGIHPQPHLTDKQAGRVDNRKEQIRRAPGIPEAEHFAAGRIDLRMGGESMRQPAAEIIRADRLQRGVDLGGRPAFPQGEHPPGMANHVGVGGVLDRIGVAVAANQRRIDRANRRHAAIQRPSGTPLGPQAGGQHEAVAIRSPSLVQPQRMQHAVAIEREHVGDRLERRIRPLRK